MMSNERGWKLGVGHPVLVEGSGLWAQSEFAGLSFPVRAKSFLSRQEREERHTERRGRLTEQIRKRHREAVRKQKRRTGDA